ncbi:hypothetical protein ACFU96_45645 [Streptomyces sp. NPDC057620]|uniref:hypothetical protein n=1 Tax=Streptomyces sp. NPDC057620 TaxID=3346185 RepID=UPI0036A207C8
MVFLIAAAGLAAVIPFAVQAKRTAPAYDRTGLTAAQKPMLDVLWLIADDRTWLNHASSAAIHRTTRALARKCSDSQSDQLRAVRTVPGIGPVTDDERQRTLSVYAEYCDELQVKPPANRM